MVNIDKIKDICKEKGIKQNYICARLGLAKGYLNDITRGKNSMSDERLAQIADILGVSCAYLLDETDDPSPVDGEPAEMTDLEKLQAVTIDMLKSIEDVKQLKMVLAMLEASQTPDERT